MANRHLLAIDSPPDDHEPDNQTLGPVLPTGWGGDAWMRESSDGNSYWLRAWNKSTGRYSIAQGTTYEETRAALVADVEQGGSYGVQIQFTETARQA